MGAVPSREAIQSEGCLPQCPFYGQRQRIVLIPLTREYFPSPDCPLFRQFVRAHADPAVRYHSHPSFMPTHRAKQGSQNHHSSNRSASEKEEEEVVCDIDSVTGSWACAPPDRFPSRSIIHRRSGNDADTNLTDEEREAEAKAEAELVYKLTVERTRVYDTNKDMIEAYRSDPTSVRPLPCVIAFLYTLPPAATTAAGANTTSSINNNANTSAISKIPEGCVEVMGCYVKATGFIGHYPDHNSDNKEGNTTKNAKNNGDELYMFLTKSAGDHNRTHALIAATYTYFEQWQRACASLINNTANNGEGSRAAVVDFTRAYPSEAEANESLRKLPPLPFPVEVAKLQPQPQLAKDNSNNNSNNDTNNNNNNDSNNSDKGKTVWMLWAPPPLAQGLRLHSRRANIPLLCCLRELRAALVGLCRDVHHIYHWDMWLQEYCIADYFTYQASSSNASSGDGSEKRENEEEGDCHSEVFMNVCVLPTAVRELGSYLVRSLLQNCSPLTIDEYGNDDPSLLLTRLDNDNLVVEPWAAIHRLVPSTVAEDQVLLIAAQQYTDHHLFFTVGPSLAERRAATAALRGWVGAGRGVVYGFAGMEAPDKSVKTLEEYSSLLPVTGERVLNPCVGLQLRAMRSGEEARSLRVSRVALEELLLGELRDSCQQARDAGPGDPHWVRAAPLTDGAEGQARRFIPGTIGAAAAAAGSGGGGGEDGEEGEEEDGAPAVVPPEAADIIGDGTTCLWRVTLATGAERIVSVTPAFLKPHRRRQHPKKKKLSAKSAVMHGTALGVFCAGALLAPPASSNDNGNKGASNGRAAEGTAAEEGVAAADAGAAQAAKDNKKSSADTTPPKKKKKKPAKPSETPPAEPTPEPAPVPPKATVTATAAAAGTAATTGTSGAAAAPAYGRTLTVRSTPETEPAPFHRPVPRSQQVQQQLLQLFRETNSAYQDPTAHMGNTNNANPGMNKNSLPLPRSRQQQQQQQVPPSQGHYGGTGPGAMNLPPPPPGGMLFPPPPPPPPNFFYDPRAHASGSTTPDAGPCDAAAYYASLAAQGYAYGTYGAPEQQQQQTPSSGYRIPTAPQTASQGYVTSDSQAFLQDNDMPPMPQQGRNGSGPGLNRRGSTENGGSRSVWRSAAAPALDSAIVDFTKDAAASPYAASRNGNQEVDSPLQFQLQPGTSIHSPTVPSVSSLGGFFPSGSRTDLGAGAGTATVASGDYSVSDAHVTVRVRHHHARTGSRTFSDAAASASATGYPQPHSALAPDQQQQQPQHRRVDSGLPPTSPTSHRGPASFSQSQRQRQALGAGGPGSIGSGDMGSVGSGGVHKVEKSGGRFRWDWRAAGSDLLNHTDDI